MSGAVWTSVKREYMGDHLLEQLPPVMDWGTEYLTSPIATRAEGDLVRILGKSDGLYLTHIFFKFFHNSSFIKIKNTEKVTSEPT